MTKRSIDDLLTIFGMQREDVAERRRSYAEKKKPFTAPVRETVTFEIDNTTPASKTRLSLTNVELLKVGEDVFQAGIVWEEKYVYQDKTANGNTIREAKIEKLGPKQLVLLKLSNNENLLVGCQIDLNPVVNESGFKTLQLTEQITEYGDVEYPEGISIETLTTIIRRLDPGGL